jgi:hypothetical protein
MNERRIAERKPVRILVKHQSSSDGGYEVDYASDLSTGGMFIASRSTPPRRATVHVQFSPGKDALVVSTFALVTHVSSLGFGAAFIGLDSEAASAISAIRSVV